MATAISLSTEAPHRNIQPECDQATYCYWFEKIGMTSSRCANRDSMVCRKRCDDIFAPHTKYDLKIK